MPDLDETAKKTLRAIYSRGFSSVRDLGRYTSLPVAEINASLMKLKEEHLVTIQVVPPSSAIPGDSGTDVYVAPLQTRRAEIDLLAKAS